MIVRSRKSDGFLATGCMPHSGFVLDDTDGMPHKGFVSDDTDETFDYWLLILKLGQGDFFLYVVDI